MMLQREKIFLYLYLHLSLYLLLSISNTHTYILVRLVSLDALNSPTKPSIHRYNVASTNETREYELWHPSVHKSKQIQHKGMANVKKLADKIPSVQQMIKWSRAGRDKDGAVILNKRLFELHKENGLILPVIRWLYTSNKAHIRRLKKHEMIKEVDSKYQFILMTGSMDKETRFQLLKREAHFARELMRKWSESKVMSALSSAYVTYFLGVC
jgi:hypothetical protein